jgi:hypothetical protein
LGFPFGLLNISKQIAIVFPDVADAGHNDRPPRHSQTDHGQDCCHKCMADLKKRTDVIKFDSDRYVACMTKAGEAS